MLSSIKELDLKEYSISGSLYNLQEILVECIYDYILKTPTRNEPKSRSITEQRKKIVKDRDNCTCQLCQNKFSEDDLEVDHIYPFSLGGSNDIKNLMAIYKKCNREKSNTVNYYKSKEGNLKLRENIRDFVKSLLIIENFGEWLTKVGDKRRKVIIERNKED